MANRDADNIRRIVGVNEINRGLDAAQERPPIPGQRGLAYLAPTQGSGASGSVAQGTTTSANSTDGFATGITPANQTHQQDLQSKLSGGTATSFDPGNPDSWYWGENNGVYDAGNVIDGTAGPGRIDPKTGQMSDVIRGLDGLRDCSNTTDIKLFNNDNFPTPDGWDDADTPPAGTDTSWQSGYFWLSTWGSATNQPTLVAAAQEIANGLGGTVTKIEDTGFAPSQYTATIQHAVTQGFAINRYACPSSPDICVGSAPNWPTGYTATEGDFPYASSTSWPTDSTMYLKYSGGKFSTSKYESDLGIGWEPETDYGAIDFSFEGGTRFGRIEPSAGGGMLIYETDTCSGSATGTITETYSSGAIAGYHPVENLTHLRPKS